MYGYAWGAPTACLSVAFASHSRGGPAEARESPPEPG